MTYTAAVERHGRMWLVTIVELGLMHAVDRLDRVEYASRELIAARRHADPESFDIRITDGGGFAL